MLIAIDYDETYTRDSIVWDKIISLLLLSGHAVICATSRRNTFENREDIERNLPMIPIVFCNYNAKAEMCRKAGYNVDVWIDDNPYSIDPDGHYTPEETKRRFAEWRDKVES